MGVCGRASVVFTWLSAVWGHFGVLEGIFKLFGRYDLVLGSLNHLTKHFNWVSRAFRRVFGVFYGQTFSLWMI